MPYQDTFSCAWIARGHAVAPHRPDKKAATTAAAWGHIILDINDLDAPFDLTSMPSQSAQSCEKASVSMKHASGI
jgi:hypothetical protein